MTALSSLPVRRSLRTLAGPLVAAALLVTTPAVAPAQEEAPDRPEANPEDVKSPDAIVEAAYEVISGPADEDRDWERFRSLFLPEGRLIPTTREKGEPTYVVDTVEGFIERAKKVFAKEDFYEREIHAVTERFGDIAHVFSTYESLRSPDGEPFSRGINSFQLWYDGDRWWIADIFWHSEREGAPIPERYGG